MHHVPITIIICISSSKPIQTNSCKSLYKMILPHKDTTNQLRMIATNNYYRMIATDDYQRLIATKVTTDGFLQLDFHWTRNLKTGTGTRYSHPEQGVF